MDINSTIGMIGKGIAISINWIYENIGMKYIPSYPYVALAAIAFVLGILFTRWISPNKGSLPSFWLRLLASAILIFIIFLVATNNPVSIDSAVNVINNITTNGTVTQ